MCQIFFWDARYGVCSLHISSYYCELWIDERIRLVFLSFPFLSFLLPREDGIFLIRSGLLCAQHGIVFLCVVGCRMRYLRCLLDSDPESRMGRVQTVGAALGMFQPEVGA